MEDTMPFGDIYIDPRQPERLIVQISRARLVAGLITSSPDFRSDPQKLVDWGHLNDLMISFAAQAQRLPNKDEEAEAFVAIATLARSLKLDTNVGRHYLDRAQAIENRSQRIDRMIDLYRSSLC